MELIRARLSSADVKESCSSGENEAKIIIAANIPVTKTENSAR